MILFGKLASSAKARTTGNYCLKAHVQMRLHVQPRALAFVFISSASIVTDYSSLSKPRVPDNLRDKCSPTGDGLAEMK